MYQRKTVVRNGTGLHLRPASEFVALAGKSESDITIRRAGSETAVDAKSIVMLLHLAISKDTEVEIAAQGEDEVRTVDGLIDLIESGFGDM